MLYLVFFFFNPLLQFQFQFALHLFLLLLLLNFKYKIKKYFQTKKNNLLYNMLYCVDVWCYIQIVEHKNQNNWNMPGTWPQSNYLGFVFSSLLFFIFVHTYTYICMYIENVRHTNNKTYLKKFCSKISQQKSTRLYIPFWMKRVFCATSAKILVALKFACNHQIKYTL